MKIFLALILSAFSALGAASTNVSFFKGIDADSLILNTLNLGTVANGGTATLVLATNVYRATFSGATATIALPAITITTNDYLLMIKGTNTSGGSQIITFPALIRDELSSTVPIATITNNTGAAFRIRFESSGAAWLNVDASGDALVFAASASIPVEFILVASDESTAITTGTAKVHMFAPYAFTLTELVATANTAPTGSTILLDLNESGSTVLSTRVMMDAGEDTSATATTPYVFSDTAIASGSKLTVDFDQVGSSVAGTGIQLLIRGTR